MIHSIKKHNLVVCSILLLFTKTTAQKNSDLSRLELENIMKGYDWTGTPPSRPMWNFTGSEFYFKWNPEFEQEPSRYLYSIKEAEISKLTQDEEEAKIITDNLIFNRDRSLALFTEDGKLFSISKKDTHKKLLLELSDKISNPFFSYDEKSIFFTLEDNLYKYIPGESSVIKITNIVDSITPKKGSEFSNNQEEWLYYDQMKIFDVLKTRKELEDSQKAKEKILKEKLPVAVPKEKKRVLNLSVNQDEHFVACIFYQHTSDSKQAIMPEYVNESGFTDNKKVRAKVGYPYGSMQLGLIDLKSDTFYYADISELPGIYNHYSFGELPLTSVDEEQRKCYINTPSWSPDKDKLVVNIRSVDNKDRWIALVDFASGKIKSLDWQHDSAWIAGPGIGWSGSSCFLGWLPDNKTIYFQSEESGYSHLFTLNTESGIKKQITKGKFEVYDPFLSNDKQSFYFTSNEENPGVRHFYKIAVSGEGKQKLTSKTGNNRVYLSPDETKMMVMYSYANKPWELYFRELTNKKHQTWSDYKQITNSYSQEFYAYKWRIPEFIEITARDGIKIPARIYHPDPDKKNNAGIIFVHGAGYLQNAHQWWSVYYREYMFNNFLTDHGYTVLDIDYRASAGYGRDWRTAIYRNMGGKDLSDNIDGAGYLVTKEDIDPDRLGIYGGSYGGFITLMALFKEPGIFESGAALRPVTDWAHYNHGYTSNILNTPFEDSIAYRNSSPIYYAEGLEDHLLMCHGMVDDNVHFQDVVRLSQRLIELQKNNWELAVYPLEAHGFKEWTSWYDEYRRIFKLFEETLNYK